MTLFMTRRNLETCFISILITYEKIFSLGAICKLNLHNGVFKGQLISKCHFGVFKSSRKPTKCFPGFLASKKWSNQKSGVRD